VPFSLVHFHNLRRTITVYFLLFSVLTPDLPTVLECIRFRGRERRINIPQEIGSNYYYFGLHLLDDPNGTRVHKLELEYRQNAERINTEILREWATGRGKKPVNWKTLTKVLRTIGLGTLASEIEAVKKKCNYVLLHSYSVLIHLLHNNHALNCWLFCVRCIVCRFLLLLLYVCFIDRFKSDIITTIFIVHVYSIPSPTNQKLPYHKNCTGGTLDLIITSEFMNHYIRIKLDKICATSSIAIAYR